MIKVKCDACNAMTEVDTIHVFDEPEAVLDRNEVKTLAASIARGDMQTAALSLDVLFRDEPEVREWIALGRNSLRARPLAA